MAKDKPLKVKGVANKHLHARTTFLYQAATYLTLQTGSTTPHAGISETVSEQKSRSTESSTRAHSGLALQFGSHLHTVSRKGQVRLAPDLKRSICKSCNCVLIPGRTSTQLIENKSKGGRKPWADVLVIRCALCGHEKRFPVGAKRQLSKGKRSHSSAEENLEIKVDELDHSTTPALQTGIDQSPSSG